MQVPSRGCTNFWTEILYVGGFYPTTYVFHGLQPVLAIANFMQPHNTRWITAFERRLAQARLSEDAGEADKDNAEDS